MFKRFFYAINIVLVLLAMSGQTAIAKIDSEQSIFPTQQPSTSTHLTHKSVQSADSSVLNSMQLGQSGISYRYEKTYGITGEPYVADTDHLNAPYGIYMDPDDNLYVTEITGDRLLKFNSSGNNTLVIGHAGTGFAHDDFLPLPEDVTVSSDGHIWIVSNPVVKEYDADGNLVRSIPEPNPWESGNDDYHFTNPKGLVFSHSGYLFVSDTDNHRIQIYDTSTETPTYINTIGETGVADSDAVHFTFPGTLAVDSSDALYVLDSGNYRVQKCTSMDAWVSWSCSTFFGGTQGSDTANGEMSWSFGLHVDQSDNVFIADGVNSQILKCTTAGVCTKFVGTLGVRGTGDNVFGWAADVTTDSAGNLYVSDTDNFVIKKYSSTGEFIENWQGVTNVPYVADTLHLSTPSNLTVDSLGNLFVTEAKGYRLIKMNSDGNQLWTIGTAGIGIYDWEGERNDAFSGWREGNPALDSKGNLYISDTGNHRVQIYNAASGAYVDTLGVFREWGDDNGHFSCPIDIAVSPVNGDIYIDDLCNQRIQIFNSQRGYKATIGTTGEIGTDNQHFHDPRGIAVDKGGNIYIADTENFRIQKCVLIGTTPSCSTFLGEVGVYDTAFNHFHPRSLAVNAKGWIFVVDDWTNRILVYDSTGAFLTSIGGNWGQRTGDLVSATGVAVDSNGKVYIADYDNHRVQRFSLGEPDWKQVNINGFGDPSNLLSVLEVFNGQLYAGVTNWDQGAMIYRTDDGKSWTATAENGFDDPSNNQIISDMTVFGNSLYAGTISGDSTGQIWRSADGIKWDQVVPNTFSGGTNSLSILGAYNGQIYAGTWNSDGIGSQIWKSTSGNSGTWAIENNNGFGNGFNDGITSFQEFSGYLYAGTENTQTGSELWRKSANTGWESVNTDGFGEDNHNGAVNTMVVYNHTLYAGTSNCDMGGEIWRSLNGTTWTKVIDAGFGDINNCVIDNLIVYKNKLFATTYNHPWNSDSTGMEVWVTEDGTNWEQINTDGFGDSSNRYDLSTGSVIWNNQLYVGTRNSANGTEIWAYELLNQRIFVPLILK